MNVEVIQTLVLLIEKVSSCRYVASSAHQQWSGDSRFLLITSQKSSVSIVLWRCAVCRRGEKGVGGG